MIVRAIIVADVAGTMALRTLVVAMIAVADIARATMLIARSGTAGSTYITRTVVGAAVIAHVFRAFVGTAVVTDVAGTAVRARPDGRTATLPSAATVRTSGRTCRLLGTLGAGIIATLTVMTLSVNRRYTHGYESHD